MHVEGICIHTVQALTRRLLPFFRASEHPESQAHGAVSCLSFKEPLLTYARHMSDQARSR